MICVPLAGLFPRYPGAPESRSHSCISSGGKPFGKVAKPFSTTIPTISQWPVVVSFPRDISAMVPKLARGAAEAGQPAIEVRLPRPQLCSVGRCRPPTWRAMLPSVFAPSSPYSAASGSAPAPTESITRMPNRPTTPPACACLVLNPPPVLPLPDHGARVRAGGGRPARLAHLRPRLGVPARKIDDGDGKRATAGQEARGERDVLGPHADGRETVAASFRARLRHFVGCRVGPEHRVIDQRREVDRVRHEERGLLYSAVPAGGKPCTESCSVAPRSSRPSTWTR